MHYDELINYHLGLSSTHNQRYYSLLLSREEFKELWIDRTINWTTTLVPDTSNFRSSGSSKDVFCFKSWIHLPLFPWCNLYSSLERCKTGKDIPCSYGTLKLQHRCHKTEKETLISQHYGQWATFQINHQLDANISPVYYLDVYLQHNMFRASSRPSSGAQKLQ
jgi:hypothetical protein